MKKFCLVIIVLIFYTTAVNAGMLEGKEAYKNKNYAKAYNIFLEEAKKGNMSAQGRIGIFYYYGKGVKKDKKSSYKWMKKSAEQGSNFAKKFIDEKLKYFKENEVMANNDNKKKIVKVEKIKTKLHGYTSWKKLSSNDIAFKNIYLTENLILDKHFQVRNFNYEGTQSYIKFNLNAAKSSCSSRKYNEKGINFKRFRLPTLKEAKSIGSYFRSERQSYKLQYIYTKDLSKDKYRIERKETVIAVDPRNGDIKYSGLNRGMFNDRKIAAVCVATTVPNSVYDIAKQLYKQDIGKIRLNLPKKPKLIKYKKLVKDEFETTNQYNSRVLKLKKKIDLENKINFEKWKKDTIYRKKIWHAKVEQAKENYEQNFLPYYGKAMYVKYGNPKIKSAKYDADNQFFTIVISSTRGGYKKRVKLPVKLKYAKKFKDILVKKNFNPTVEFEVINHKLKFSGIKEIKDPEIMVEKSEYRKAYNIDSKQKSIKELNKFIRRYTNSTLIPSAKERIATLKKKITLEEERRKKLEEERRTREAIHAAEVAKRKQRKADSFYEKKHVGEKVCMDGTVALFLSTTVTAYVERVAGNKIQLRIADTDGVTPNLNGVTLYENTLIWDNYANWYKCNY